MTVYHFDYRCDGVLVADAIGTALDTFADARTEAVRALGDLMRDELRGARRRQIAIEVREGARPVLQVQLTLEVRQFI